MFANPLVLAAVRAARAVCPDSEFAPWAATYSPTVPGREAALAVAVVMGNKPGLPARAAYTAALAAAALFGGQPTTAIRHAETSSRLSDHAARGLTSAPELDSVTLDEIRGHRKDRRSLRWIQSWLETEYGTRLAVSTLARYCKGSPKPPKPIAAPKHRVAPTRELLRQHRRPVEDLIKAGYSIRDAATLLRQNHGVATSTVSLAGFCKREAIVFRPRKNPLNIFEIGLLDRLDRLRRRIAWMLWRRFDLQTMCDMLRDQHARFRSDAPTYFVAPRILGRYIRDTGLTAEDRERRKREAPRRVFLGTMHEDLERWRNEGISYHEIVRRLKSDGARVSFSSVRHYCRAFIPADSARATVQCWTKLLKPAPFPRNVSNEIRTTK